MFQALAAQRKGDSALAAQYASAAFFLSSPGCAVVGNDYDLWEGIIKGASKETPFESKVVVVVLFCFVLFCFVLFCFFCFFFVWLVWLSFGCLTVPSFTLDCMFVLFPLSATSY